MSIVRVESSALVRAPARVVYQLIADYRNGHPRILPKQYFPMLEVEKGGVGAGTVIRYQIRLAGTTRDVRAEVTEPTPGRVLVETDLARGARTTFTVTPESGETCRVQFLTEWEAKGIRGGVERMTAPSLLRRVFAAELAQLSAVAEGEHGRPK